MQIKRQLVQNKKNIENLNVLKKRTVLQKVLPLNTWTYFV